MKQSIVTKSTKKKPGQIENENKFLTVSLLSA